MAEAVLPTNKLFQLNVTNLSYDPPTNMVKILDEAKTWVQSTLPERARKYIPQMISESSLHAQLISVSFRAKAGEVTGILSTSLPERKSLSDLLINRCQFGSYDGDVVMENIPYGTSFDQNCAFVHRVRTALKPVAFVTFVLFEFFRK